MNISIRIGIPDEHGITYMYWDNIKEIVKKHRHDNDKPEE